MSYQTPSCEYPVEVSPASDQAAMGVMHAAMHGPMHGPIHAASEAKAGGIGWYEQLGLRGYDFFTNYGNYMPRTHCLQTATGEVDWPWVFGLLVLTTGVIVAYIKIFVFWRRSYLQELAGDRNTKLMDLAWIFLWCAICGYAMSLLMFVWPAYRLLAGFLVVLNLWSWRFAANLGDFKVSLGVKRLERELSEARADRVAELERTVAERTRELLAAREAAETASRSKSEFLANMSHEIRTPLTAILGFTDILCDDGNNSVTPARRLETINTINSAGKHLLTVINDILDLSKIEADKMTVEQVEMPLAGLLHDVMSLMRSRAVQKGVNLSVTLAGTIPHRIISDPTRMRQILMNLVGNAVKFTSKGSVTIAARVDRVKDQASTDAAGTSQWLQIDVIDTGPGMAPEQAERLFQAFSQADTTVTRRHGGTGLGLSICRRLAVLMGGSVTLVHTDPGKGSTFRLNLPLVPASDAKFVDRLDAVKPPATITPSANLPRLNGRILLAEDGIDNQRLIAFHLRNAGATVDIAENGRIALEMLLAAEAAGTPYALLLTDMQMPEMDGYTLAKTLRERGSQMAIVALTAHAMADDRTKCLEAGCNDYASKPIDKASLLATCAQWMGTLSRNESPVV